MPVVRCNNLAQLKAQWDTIIAQHRQPQPNNPGHQHLPNARLVHSAAQANLSLSPADFQQLVNDLAKYPRLEWFYYTDNADGIALRLYDSQFKKACPRYFREPASQSGDEYVILRGKDLGPATGDCKTAMEQAFGAQNIGQDLGAGTQQRLVFFEDSARNKASGGGGGGGGSRTTSPSMMDLLRQFGQVILYGPPGTGKTREAKRVALSLLTGTPPDGEIEQQLKPFHEAKRYEIVVFHPAYEYEQFVGGIEPMIDERRQLAFDVKAGVFLRLCRHAEQSTQPAVLIIDEINRGNLPKLLGELVYALEYRYPPHWVTLPFVCDRRNDLRVPKNLYIIATMNSSDRSIGHIDVAIRRRFGLYHIGPNPDVVRNAWQQIAGAEAYGGQLARLMTDLNQALGGEDPTAEVELGVGHSYFLPNPGSARDAALQQVRMKWEYQVKPLLREYAQLLNLGATFFQRFGNLPPA